MPRSRGPVSRCYGDVYASRDGALGQARHVFLAGTGCVERWRERRQFVVLESGFGLGVNFLTVWRAWRDDPARPARLHFMSIERHPLPGSAFVDAVAPELRDLGAHLAAQWPLPVAGLHRCEFEEGRVILTLAFGDARAIAPELRLGADAIFLDGFAPGRTPEMWEASLLRSIARLARADCRVATWCTARAVREALADAVFDIELQPGFASKRQMLVGRYAPRYTVRDATRRCHMRAGAASSLQGCARKRICRWSSPPRMCVFDPAGYSDVPHYVPEQGFRLHGGGTCDRAGH